MVEIGVHELGIYYLCMFCKKRKCGDEGRKGFGRVQKLQNNAGSKELNQKITHLGVEWKTTSKCPCKW